MSTELRRIAEDYKETALQNIEDYASEEDEDGFDVHYSGMSYNPLTDMYKCDCCGNVWDGNAQCQCRP